MTRSALGAGLLLAIAVAYGAWRAPETIRTSQAQTRVGEALTRLERELEPARMTDTDPRILVRARELIPPHAVFYVALGDRVRVSTPVTLDAFPVFASYWLLPRRRTPDPASVAWVVSYGGHLDELGLRYRRVVRVDDGLALAEVAR